MRKLLIADSLATRLTLLLLIAVGQRDCDSLKAERRLTGK